MRSLLKIFIILSIVLISFPVIATDYNIYALDKLTLQERLKLAEFIEDSSSFRIGGEEYEHKDYDPLIFAQFIKVKSGSVSLTANGNLEKILREIEVFQNANIPIDYIFFKNEIWFEIQDWKHVKKDLWTYLLNKPKYYRKHSVRYVNDAKDLIIALQAEGIEIEVILNVPLPQNNLLREMLSVIKEMWSGAVDVHIYGKWNEADYFDKLEQWLNEIFDSNFSNVVCGEMNGLFNHKEGRELKNGSIHKMMHSRIMSVLENYNVDTVYYFTLCANGSMMNWKNPPIYNRFLVTSDQVIDQLNNVFD